MKVLDILADGESWLAQGESVDECNTGKGTYFDLSGAVPLSLPIPSLSFSDPLALSPVSLSMIPEHLCDRLRGAQVRSMSLIIATTEGQAVVDLEEYWQCHIRWMCLCWFAGKISLELTEARISDGMGDGCLIAARALHNKLITFDRQHDHILARDISPEDCNVGLWCRYFEAAILFPSVLRSQSQVFSQVASREAQRRIASPIFDADGASILSLTRTRFALKAHSCGAKIFPSAMLLWTLLLMFLLACLPFEVSGLSPCSLSCSLSFRFFSLAQICRPLQFSFLPPYSCPFSFFVLLLLFSIAFSRGGARDARRCMAKVSLLCSKVVCRVLIPDSLDGVSFSSWLFIGV